MQNDHGYDMYERYSEGPRPSVGQARPLSNTELQMQDYYDDNALPVSHRLGFFWPFSDAAGSFSSHNHHLPPPPYGVICPRLLLFLYTPAPLT